MGARPGKGRRQPSNKVRPVQEYAPPQTPDHEKNASRAGPDPSAGHSPRPAGRRLPPAVQRQRPAATNLSRMHHHQSAELNRRDFLKGGSFATLMTMLGGVELISRAPARAADLETLVPFQVKCGVIGLGNWGREIIATLSRLKTAQLVAVCDTYPASLKRGTGAAPNAKGVEDYRRILDDKDVQAVVIATPTHQHR